MALMGFRTIVLESTEQWVYIVNRVRFATRIVLRTNDLIFHIFHVYVQYLCISIPQYLILPLKQFQNITHDELNPMVG